MDFLKQRSLWALFLIFGLATAHGGHENVPEGESVSLDPIDSTLWIHMILMGFAFGIVFPLGMVLGIVRSRWHVPVQIVGTVVAVLAYFLGHAHKGRQFSKNVHHSFANWLMLMLVVQVALGFYLKLHLVKAGQGRIRWIFVLAHGIVGKVMPVVSWAQMVFGGIAAMGFCQADHLGQCLAHFIMGSAFIGYGICLTILLLVGQFWLRRTGRSQEFFDSLIIAAWGCVNTFTEHRWGQEWAHNDLQHTTMGVVWWCAGLLGMWLSRSRNGRPKRNLIPALVILITGYAMSAHAQSLMISTMIHSIFGYTLMAAGATRIIEISFVLGDKSAISMTGVEPNSFQHLPPFLLYASGFLFMGATEEQMLLLHNAGITHVSYVLILYSVAFIMYLFVNVLVHIYATHAWPEGQEEEEDQEAHKYANVNGAAYMNGNGNGHVRSRAEAQRIEDAEAFELHGLIDEDDEEEVTTPTGPKKMTNEESAH
ncbi:hypothetical protein N7456_013668 [Penicillium angulare]|uniref:Integral membrane protein n=1 Tax=Penicillium angulare TaxID=116970 RepID=A0A9W9EFP2_9EURO|nr:hypothetical protein N7456_013668 [Penicillium angulare]